MKGMDDFFLMRERKCRLGGRERTGGKYEREGKGGKGRREGERGERNKRRKE